MSRMTKDAVFHLAWHCFGLSVDHCEVPASQGFKGFFSAVWHGL
ncbi:hypothetical protein ALO83_103877 [Pseudomonas cannabina pv. alisalensis]|uniref:Uncharacterized protein n=1 Tax=Pseudomonas cannabina TaxID=86840 RepID=A0A3M3QU30_PSECA|nr:hypothetical protein ALO83_103877 [Pseudomonas cannabina pv. alisalensis]RMN75516.1 hypothetical protein ALQ53_103611 [Pseudomonas cannabina]RMN82259.1 hypothetical protein ALQ52_104575 [Pseudomonas cannabina pv. alisalensis]RMN87754.1 hypothetical protein ALQ51_102249 [Pseudomonas cannabina]